MVSLGRSGRFLSIALVVVALIACVLAVVLSMRWDRLSFSQNSLLVSFFVPPAWRPGKLKKLGKIEGFDWFAQDGTSGERIHIKLSHPDVSEVSRFLGEHGFVANASADSKSPLATFESDVAVLQTDAFLPCDSFAAECRRVLIVIFSND